VCLPKRNAEAGRACPSQGNFFVSDVPGPAQGAAPDNGKAEEASGAHWEAHHPIRRHGECFQTACGQAESQRANQLGRGARQQTPSSWRWIRATARDSTNHGPTGYPRQPPTRITRGESYVLGCPVRVRRPSSDKWDAEAHSQRFGLVRTRCLDGDQKGACPRTCPGL